MRRLPWIPAVGAALLVAGAVSADESSIGVGGEVQIYPAGVIPGVRVEFARRVQTVWSVRAAYNATDRSDFGEHDDEDGGGAGFGVGYRRYFDEGLRGWAVGGRVDVWSLEIDWIDFPDTSMPREGTTDVIVLQPTVEGVYSWALGDSGWRLDATASLGAEINVDTDGEDVGEGAILLAGASFVRRW